MGLNFVAVDFETANRSHDSVCAVAAVRTRDGVIVDEYRALVCPPGGADDFESANTRVHGIDSTMVADAPIWPAVYRDLRSFLQDDVVVGHNVSFDVSVLQNACSAYDLSLPTLNTLCTLELARAALRVPSYSLPWVTEHLGLPAFDHHDPLADARASALVLVALAERIGATDVWDLSRALAVPVAPTWSESEDAVFAALTAKSDDIIGTGFAGEVVCFTGALKMMIRERARELVVEQGGTWQDGVTRKTTILVTGDFDERSFRPGAAFSSKLTKAFAQIEAGQKLEIITEEAFITRMTLGEQELRARIGARKARSKLPEWVLIQSGNGPNGDFWSWYRAALAHPDGRASDGDPCIWCDAPIPERTHWVHRDRRVCSVHCNERLKRSASRAWRNAGIRFSPPDWG
ncbi:exonuclease domain-containing protein [Microbacterium sp. GXF7504]